MRHIPTGLMLLCCLMLSACVSRMGVGESFEKDMKAYNRMVRWQEVENAGMLYMEPEQREIFLKSAETLKKKGVTITDFRILTSEYLPEKQTGQVVTEFDYYIMPSNRIKTVTYRQEWAYREISEKKSWKLKSGLPLFE